MPVSSKVRDHIRQNVVGYLALFIALTIAPAWAASIGPEEIKQNAVRSKHIKAGNVKTSDLADGKVTPAKLSFDPATGAELNAHKTSDDHDGRYFTETELSSSDGNAPNTGSNRVHWNNLLGMPPGFVDGTDDTGSGGGWSLTGDAGTSPATNFLGTTDNVALNLRVNNARALRLEPASDGTNESPNVIGGIADNQVTAGVHSATISGGGRHVPADPATANRVTDNAGTVGGGADNQAGDSAGTLVNAAQATVGGGFRNTASGSVSTIGGGEANTASGVIATVGGGQENTASNTFATVGGGQQNVASGSIATVGGGIANAASGVRSTVAGGNSNTASGTRASVGGGFINTASGAFATVPGGDSNTAQGSTSFAAGLRAKANHDGAFVWADSQDADMASAAANQFIARAAGEFFLQSDSTLDDQGGFLNTSTGGFLSTAGAWTDSSDERLKSGFQRVEPRRVLEAVAGLPVRSWEYDAEPGVRHIGPVAQDFHRAFGVGADRRHIAALDANGVALAAIKGLEANLSELEDKVEGTGGIQGSDPALSLGAWAALGALALAIAAATGAALALRFARVRGGIVAAS